MTVLAFGLLVASPLVGFDTWPSELAANWRPQVVVLLAVAAVVALASRHRLLALLLVMLSLVQGIDVISYASQSAQLMAYGAKPDATPITIAESNIEWSNPDPSRLIAWVKAQRPDVLVVSEVTQVHRKAFASRLKDYQFRLIAPSKGYSTTALYSRWPMITSRIESLGPQVRGASQTSAIIATVATDHGNAQIVFVHPVDPIRPADWWARNRQYDALDKVLASLHGPVIVVGDFNATPWSPELRRLARRADLTGFNIDPTFPAWSGPAGVAIDQILVSHGLTVSSIEKGPNVGSDHWPLMARIEGFLSPSGTTP